jgi:hypothetical protein
MEVNDQFHLFTALYPGKGAQYPLNIRTGRVQSWSYCLKKRKNLLPLTGIKPQLLNHTNCTLVTTLACIGRDTVEREK